MSSSNIHNSVSMSKNEVADFLEKCGLDQYIKAFLEEGFDIMVAVQEITEEDLEAMKVKRGHRRVIQRELATLIGIPKNQPIVVNSNPFFSIVSSTTLYSPSNECGEKNPSSNVSNIFSSGLLSSQLAPSFNHLLLACVSPGALKNTTNERRSLRERLLVSFSRFETHLNSPSGYIAFSGTAHIQSKNQTTVPCSTIGSCWSNLNTYKKHIYELNDKEEKSKHVKSLMGYEKTINFRNYHIYLAEFKRKYEEKLKNTRERKRTKLNISANC
ncbi:hypothetical protein BY458DRAFT_498621 [Sporodiniella umbellata]|nr:hypothetical protein BY458DRAFT_498621 [Sporodiniella umbellata]